jgi:thiamine kinase
MRVEDLIDGWRGWDADLGSRPEVLEVLSGGLSNRSYLLGPVDRKMVLRINGAGSMLPGGDRGNEVRAWQAASAAEIAPALVHVDEQGRFLVSEYIEGKLRGKPQDDEGVVERAFQLLGRCHLLDVDVPAIDYAAHVEQYWGVIESGGIAVPAELTRQRESMRRLLEELITSDTRTGVCHHDLVTGNFVGGPEKLYLIDWEYAALGSPLMDYAAFGVEWGVGDDVVAERAGVDLGLLVKAKDFYRYECELWGIVSAFGRGVPL